MARQRAKIIAQCTDVYGALWDVHEWRITVHGFAMGLGWPTSTPKGKGGVGGIRTILTQGLVDYLAATPRPKDIALPIGATAIKRIRRELGLYWDWSEFWETHREELFAMPIKDFATKYGVNECNVSTHRVRMREKCD